MASSGIDHVATVSGVVVGMSGAGGPLPRPALDIAKLFPRPTRCAVVIRRPRFDLGLVSCSSVLAGHLRCSVLKKGSGVVSENVAQFGCLIASDELFAAIVEEPP